MGLEEIATPGGAEKLLTYGPLGVAVVVLLWFVSYLLRRQGDADEAHRIEVAAERKLNSDLQNARLADHKMLIEVAQSLRIATEIVSSRDDIRELVEQVQELSKHRGRSGS